MWVLGDGKKHYLELLRNLSIQFIMMGFSLIIFNKLYRTLSKGNYSDGVFLGLICAVILALLTLAIIANLKNFFAEFSTGVAPHFNEYRSSISEKTRVEKVKLCFLFLMRNGKSAVIEFLLLILGVYFLISVGLFYSIESVDTFLKSEAQRHMSQEIQAPQSQPASAADKE